MNTDSRQPQSPDPLLLQKARLVPDSPGVYLLKDPRGSVLYVGKAKSLKKRVASYLRSSKDLKTRHLQARIADLEVLPTGNEAEALLLENNLIKQWKPKYNINLKDGKTYPVIRLTSEEYPRVFRTRRLVFDGSRYYGPFPKVGLIDLYLNLIDKLFPLRKCRLKINSRKQPCFYYHIGRCAGVCAGKMSREEYQERVNRVHLLLSGRTEELARDLRRRMQQAAEAREYEKAATLRDQIQAIETLSEEQKVEDFREESRDYLGFCSEATQVRLTVLQMRAGKLAGRESFLLENSGGQEFLATFLGQYYGNRSNPPRTVYLPPGPETHVPELLGRFLSDLTGTPVGVRVPRRGRHARLVSMAAESARLRLEGDTDQRREAVAALAEALGLREPPRRIEGFDIAHLAGKQTVASLVAFQDAQPRRGGYRHYHIRSLDGRIDDFEAMREVVARRYTRQLNEGRELPELILVDGGKGQVSAAAAVLKALEIPRIAVVGLAKRNEELFLPGRSDPLVLPRDSAALRLLQAVRDEAHRFATTFHKRVRAAELAGSVLESVPGIGPRRSRALLSAFGSLEELGGRSAQEIAHAAAISLPHAEALLAHLREIGR
jgi:excinuclease ABC subunit C